MKLFVGNYVTLEEEVIQVISVHVHGIDYYPKERASSEFRDFGAIRGLPLTPALLKALGFYRKFKAHHGQQTTLFCRGRFALLWDEREPGYFYPLVEDETGDYLTYGAVALYYLHELQQSLWVNFEEELPCPPSLFANLLNHPHGPDQRN